jgi:DNA/RNA endonuclease YhcR with UshA esterase domain
MKTHTILIFASLLFIGSCTYAQHKIKAEDAKNYKSKSDTVVGKVYQIKSTDKAVYINIGGKYPDNPFTAVIFQKDIVAVGDVSKYDGKLIDVIGVITDYKDKTEIIVNDAKQLMLDK